MSLKLQMAVHNRYSLLVTILINGAEIMGANRTPVRVPNVTTWIEPNSSSTHSPRRSTDTVSKFEYIKCHWRTLVGHDGGRKDKQVCVQTLSLYMDNVRNGVAA